MDNGNMRAFSFLLMLVLSLAAIAQDGYSYISEAKAREVEEKAKLVKPGMTVPQMWKTLGITKPPQLIRGSGPREAYRTAYILRPDFTMLVVSDDTKKPPRVVSVELSRRSKKQMRVQQLEPDRIAIQREQEKNLLADFRTFEALSLNGQYGTAILMTVGDTLKEFGVRWAEPGPKVPVLVLTFQTSADPLLPSGYVIGTLSAELRTELTRDLFKPNRHIRHPFGMSPRSFIATSEKDAEERAIKELKPFLERLGKLWRESHR